jgi:cellulose synthase/poly-beta-1,6-N-acetylglucosamine synthase-like glycosyltransferase
MLTRESGVSTAPTLVSIVIPTYNGASRVAKCLEALCKQRSERNIEILIVNDGSTDNTAQIVRGYSGVRLISQQNAGPAAARNRGALEAQGAIILFTDDDCEPIPEWLESMLTPFKDPDVVAAKGVYRTRQRSLAARFVQVEYEDRYRYMAGLSNIDFVDTYSAAFRRERFLEIGGYDISFPVACAEDIELSYRMSARGWKMKFAPSAIVYHTHPNTLSAYIKKKYKFAFWRVLAVRKNPSKAVKDSHTPQLMKLQLLLPPALVLALAFDMAVRPVFPVSAIVLVAFLLSTLPFAFRAFAKDPIVGLVSPALLAVRACAQVVGVSAGLFFARRKTARIPFHSGSFRCW